MTLVSAPSQSGLGLKKKMLIKANNTVSGNSSIDQILFTYVLPEFERRLKAGNLTDDYIGSHPEANIPGTLRLPSIALILLEDSSELKVLFDGETGVLLLGLTTHEQSEQEIRINDLILGGFRIDDLPANAGWILLINQAGSFRLFFDLRRNKLFAQDHLLTGKAFIRAATFSLRLGNPRVAIENLFQAAEKVAKAELLLLPLNMRNGSNLKKSSHGSISNKYHQLGQEKGGKELLKELERIRPSSTYFQSELKLKKEEIQGFIKRAKLFASKVQKLVPIELDSILVQTWPIEVNGVSHKFAFLDGAFQNDSISK